MQGAMKMVQERQLSYIYYQYTVYVLCLLCFPFSLRCWRLFLMPISSHRVITWKELVKEIEIHCWINFKTALSLRDTCFVYYSKRDLL